MKHITFLILAVIAVVASSCSDLTDDEKKFLGTWSSEEYGDSVLDEQSGIRMIFTVNDLMNYNKDKTYDDKGNCLIKIECPFNDVTIRLYSFYHINGKNSWSADNGVYTDSTIRVSLSANLVSSNNVLAIKDNRTGKIKKYSLYDRELDEIYDKDIINDLRTLHREFDKLIRANLLDKSKTIYKIKSISDNEIVYEDNDGVLTTLKRGKVMSGRIRQMMFEGNALNALW